MRKSIATLTLSTLLFAFAATGAQAAPSTINVRIEGRGETLFEGPVATEGHSIEASSDTQERPCDGINPLDLQNTTPGPTPTAASVDAMSIIGETFDGQWYAGYDDYFITRWGPDEQNTISGDYWGVLINDVFANVGGCQYELHENDEVLWVYNGFKERANLALFPAGATASRPPLTATAQLDQPFAVQVEAYGDDKEDNPPAEPNRADATPYEGAEVSPVLTSPKGFEEVQTTSPEAVTTDAEGKASIIFTTPGWHRIKAGTPLDEEGEEEAIRSNRIDVCVPAHGETGCGSPPPEDDVRTPPALAGAPGAKNPAGGQSGNESGAAPTAPSTSTPVYQGSGSAALLELESVTAKRLLLKISAAVTVTVRIARLRGKGHRRHLHIIKTIVLKVGKAGLLKVKLPRLAAGSYQVSISLAGAKTFVKTLTIPRKRR